MAGQSYSIFVITKALIVLLNVSQFITSGTAFIGTSPDVDNIFSDAGDNGPYNLVGTCVYKSGNYTTKSEFESNLINVFSNLTSAAAASKSFYNTTAGSGASQVYGLFDCKPGLSPDACLTCVRNATDSLQEECISKEAIVYYGDCMLRYANRVIFAKSETSPAMSECDDWDPAVPDPENLNQLVSTTMERLIDQVGWLNSSDSFAAKEPNLYVDQKVYMIVQCTPDISRSECQECLNLTRNATMFCSKQGSLWGNATRPSCLIRYGFRPFFNLTTLLPSSSSSVLPPVLPPSVTLNSSSHSSGSTGICRLADHVFVNVAAVILVLKLIIRPA